MGFLKTLGRMAEKTVASTVDFVTMDINDTNAREVRRKHRDEDAAENLKALGEFLKILKD